MNEKKGLFELIEDLIDSGNVPADQEQEAKKRLEQLRQAGVTPEEISESLNIDIGNLGSIGKLIRGLIKLAANIKSGEQEFDVGGKKGVISTGFKIGGALGGKGRDSQEKPFTVKPTVKKQELKPEFKKPTIEIFDEESKVVVTAELPGVSKKDICLNLENNELTLETTGERKYKKSVSLPETVGQEFTSSFRNGILSVKIEKK